MVTEMLTGLLFTTEDMIQKWFVGFPNGKNRKSDFKCQTTENIFHSRSPKTVLNVIF